MKKICLLLIITLLLSCLFACNNSENKSIENADGTLSQWMKDEIKSAYEKRDGASWGKWQDEGYLRGPRYYGTYNGYVIIFRWGAAQSLWSIKIGKRTFKGGIEFRLFAYKDGEFHLLEDVYEQGLIGDDAIEEIWNTHREYAN